MKTESFRALRGINRWSDETVIEAIVTLDALSAQDRVGLRALLTEELAHAVLTEGDSDAREGAASLVARLAIALQRAAGCDVSFWLTRPMILEGRHRIVFEYSEESVGRRALEITRELLGAARARNHYDTRLAVDGLRKLNESVRLGPSTRSIVHAAHARGIPTRRLTEGSLVQLGFGSRQRRIWAAETDRTGAVAEAIAQDKELTKSLLAVVGVPVPKGRPASTPAEAWQAAQALGLPVVVKPRKGNQGRGVSVRLSSEESVLAAFAVAVENDGEVIVEQHIEGVDFRLLVVGGQLVAAARRDPPKVTGDGRHTVAELVALENLNPLRGEDHSTSLSKLRLDAIALELLSEQALTVDSIPRAGEVVVLRRNANLSTGGTAKDVTDEVHPEVARAAVEAAGMVGLDIAGIDVVAPRVDVPLEQSRGAIVEVNAAPGLRMHLEPSSGRPRDVGAAIIASMFAPGEDARIPIIAISGTNGKTTTTRAIAHLFERAGRRVGMTCTDGIYVQGRRIDTGDCSGPKSARSVLTNPRVDVAVLETARGGLLREGLGFDACDVAVITNIGEGDHLGLDGVETPEELAKVKEIPVRAVHARGAAVLNAEDPLVVRMAERCAGRAIFFGRNPDSPVITAHTAAGGTALTVREGALVVRTGGEERGIARFEDLPLTRGGRIGFQIENLLAVAGAGVALGLPLDVIRQGLESFSSDLGTVPGRFNVLSGLETTVILDYGHNSSALLALCASIEQIPHRRRKVVYTAAGDRRDDDIIRQAEILGGFFEEIYVYEDQCTRGRADGEIIALLYQGISRASGSPRVLRESGEMAAISAAISRLEPGDLLLCQVDQVDAALEFVTGLLGQLRTRPMSGYAAQFAATAAAVLGFIG